MNDNIVVISGGFDPVHSGHIEYIKAAAEFGRVFIGLNSDAWLTRKKGKPFMSFEERLAVLSNMKNVLCVVPMDDSDGTAIDAIQQAKDMFMHSKIIFANGGDRTNINTPEMVAFKDDPRVEFMFGVGGNKKNSSSTILSDWKTERIERTWGFYEVLHIANEAESKVKRLILEPGKSISMQRHFQRAEIWFVESGDGVIYTQKDGVVEKISNLPKHSLVHIECQDWHKLSNESKEPLVIVEIQYGNYCDESDIERL